jgi:hypothetical protein
LPAETSTDYSLSSNHRFQKRTPFFHAQSAHHA